MKEATPSLDRENPSWRNSMTDTRAESQRIQGKREPKLSTRSKKVIASILLASLTLLLPQWFGWPIYDALAPNGRWALFILVLAASLWMSEALPAFAVGILIISLQIAILGRPGGVHTAPGDTEGWEAFVLPWASPLMWLFFGGFVLAAATQKTGLDRWVALRMMQRCGTSAGKLLAGAMGITFVLSMFMSNTATAAMMVAILTPMVRALPSGNPLGKYLILSIPLAANLGGMGTIIGTPPNAIAVGQLDPEEKIAFLEWMGLGLPPAFILLAIAWLYVMAKVGRHSALPELPESEPLPPEIDRRHIGLVLVVSLLTITLWMTEKLHGVSPPVVSFLPIAAFTVSGILSAKDIRTLPWDILLLLAGGLSLGVAVKDTGLAQWLAGFIPEQWPLMTITIALAFIAVILSNAMSNTATASILLPIGVGLVATGPNAPLLVPVALACSTAMLLPISTPPNAIAYASGKLETKDFLPIGILMAVIGPLIAFGWCWLVL